MTTLPQPPYTYQHGRWVGGSPLFLLVGGLYSQMYPASSCGPGLLFVVSRRVRAPQTRLAMSLSGSFTLLIDQDSPVAMV